ncbi:hypothetical protein ABEF95_002001 [Exophiala dermatitidis]
MAVRTRAMNAAHTAGIFADMSLDGPEIGTLVAVVDRAKNLPNRKTMGKQDPYCAMRLGKEAKKTNTDKRGGQTPKWDQELRFTVHDSPDYYKLKCSVFNDDKKTDLIGEAWIDLTEVIVPGGGQNDLWHQLNFKGKYAGDVRVELTYYDTRPQPDLSSERKKSRDNAHSTASDAPSTGSTSRQLGPREIKRRPLPPGPGGHSSPVSAPRPPEEWPAEEAQPSMEPGGGYTDSNPPPRPPKQRMPETPDDVGYGIQPQYERDVYHSAARSQAPRQQRPPSHDHYDNFGRVPQQYDQPDPYRIESYDPEDLRLARQSMPQQRRESSGNSFPDMSIPDPPRHSPAQSPYQSSPPARTPPHSISPISSAPAQPQPWQSRSSTSPTKHAVYRDSPLRHSISQIDMPQPVPNYPDPRFDDGDEGPPPPPPAHREHVPRTSAVGPSYLNSQAHSAPQTPLKYSSVEERSPLQKLEREYSPYQSPSPSALQHQQPPPPVQQHYQVPVNDQMGYTVPPRNRRNSDVDNTTHPRPTSVGGVPFHQYHPERDMPRQQYNGVPEQDLRHDPGYGPPRRAQTFDTSFGSSDGRLREPDIIQQRAVSPSPSQTIPRKSITPTPATPEERSSLGSVPYGPDSYDVLNPATGPPPELDPYATPEQIKEAARQREVEKLRDQGPIIGNDGRVIDPSDHLPADTWAPEPERKNRMPEHVIRIRTKEEARRQERTGSLPAAVRPQTIAAPLHQPSSPATLSSSYQSSPVPPTSTASPSQPESSGGRNRLRKQMPTRPLPAQPYSLPQSSPAVMSVSSLEDRPSPSSQRYTISSSPSGPPPSRPPLSEYQVPAVNEYSPQGSHSFHEYGTSSMKPSSRQGNPMDRPWCGPEASQARSSFSGPENSMDFRGYGGGDSLALELSTIDIGPSRTGRTVLRPMRGYGGY